MNVLCVRALLQTVTDD